LRQVAIVTDTTACIPEEQVKKHDIEVVPIELVFENKVYRDGMDITPAEFYNLLRKADRLPTTSSSVPGPYL
jgi:fatty acid-binding protein DegV